MKEGPLFRGASIVSCSVGCLVAALIVFVVVRGTAVCSVLEPEHSRCMTQANEIALRIATVVAVIFAIILMLGAFLRSLLKRL